jgi:hypothetical protein
MGGKTASLSTLIADDTEGVELQWLRSCVSIST